MNLTDERFEWSPKGKGMPTLVQRGELGQCVWKPIIRFKDDSGGQNPWYDLWLKNLPCEERKRRGLTP